MGPGAADGSLCDRPELILSMVINYNLELAWLPVPLQVTIFQLEKIYGTSSEAKAFIESLIKGCPISQALISCPD